jgi:hypothetical protein
MKRLLLLLPGLLGAVACASAGATFSSLPAWSEYVGRYEFVAISEGQQVEGYLALHSPEEYSVRFMLSQGGGNTCTRIRKDRELELGGLARLSGNRLSLSCRGLRLSIRRDADGLEGSASWRVSDWQGPCLRVARGCGGRSNEGQTVWRDVRGSLKLTRVSAPE